MVTEGVALNSLVTDLRKEVVDLKLERDRASHDIVDHPA
jgi:hypothetical protein